jgi:hypothetical protein
MEQVVGRPFTIKVPNGKKKLVEINLSGERAPRVEVQLLNSNPTKKEIIVDQMTEQALKLDLNSFQPNDTLKLVIHEDGHPIANYMIEQKSSQDFRESIIEGRKKLFIRHNYKRAICFDQCFYTRGFGFIEIARDLEAKEQANLAGTYDLFSGVGFGAIIAAWYAAGRSTYDLSLWWGKELRKATRGGLKYLRTGQRNPKKVERALRKAFKVNGRDMLMGQLSKELFIPAMDISGRTLLITKKELPVMPVYQALMCTVLDPIDFDTKPIAKGYSIMAGDFTRSSVSFLINNTGLVTNITCPQRIYNHNQRTRSLQNIAVIMKEHLLGSGRRPSNNLVAYEAKPIDAVKRFDSRKKYIEAAIMSGKEVVNV